MPVLVALLLLVAATPLQAQVRAVALEVDNDAFNLWKDRNDRPDEQYTHGARMRMRLGGKPWGAGWLGPDAPVCGPGPVVEPCVFGGVELGQAIFTPADPRLPSVTVEDWLAHQHRRHAGWLYAETTTNWVRQNRIRTLGVQLGVTGPPSLARQAQEWFHERERTETFPGWENQIPFQVGLNALYEERRSLDVFRTEDAFSLSVEPAWGASLGNIRTSGEAGLYARLAGNAARPLGWAGVPSGFHFHAEVGWAAELVLRDLFLDEGRRTDDTVLLGGRPTHSDSGGLEKKLLVPRRELAIGVGWGPVLLEFRVLALGAEFENQLRDHTYSSIRLIASW